MPLVYVQEVPSQRETDMRWHTLFHP